jgi:DDE family transposase
MPSAHHPDARPPINARETILRLGQGMVPHTPGCEPLEAAVCEAVLRYLLQQPLADAPQPRRYYVAQQGRDPDEALLSRLRTFVPAVQPLSAGERFDSPYDPEAHDGNKRTTTWTGYKVHLTETCDPSAPHLITHVETTSASMPDVTMTAPIHEALAAKALLPSTHLVDAGDIDATLLVSSLQEHQVDLVGPVHTDVSWQARAAQGYDISAFHVDWEAQTVTCPAGHTNVTWHPRHDRWGNAVIHVDFHQRHCRPCPHRPLCTHAKTEPRELTLKPRAEHEALLAAREHQTTAAWQAQYAVRAGIEGTLSGSATQVMLTLSRDCSGR